MEVSSRGSRKIRRGRSRSFPEEALEHVLSFISSHADRNSVSLVSKSWYEIERWSRRCVLIGNCYAVSPQTLTRRFADVRSITIKGKHHSASDIELLADGWGAHALPWITALAAAYPAMEEIRLKTMVVTDEDLELIGSKFRYLRVLVLHRCQGLSEDGLSFIAANCRNLRMLGLNCALDGIDPPRDWISSFHESYTSLEFLDISDQEPVAVAPVAVEGLVARCLNLKTLVLNLGFPLENLINLLLNAPQLVHLGTGLFTMNRSPEAFEKLTRAFAGCKGLKSLSGFRHVDPYYLPTLYPACPRLTFLDLSYSCLRSPDLVELMPHCSNLQRLWVKESIEDRVLEAVAASCKELQELKVSDPDVLDSLSINLTELGLVSVVLGCPKLHYISYCCRRMTNAALLTVAKHAPNLRCFIVNTVEVQQAFDKGFGAIIERCQNLKRLGIFGLFTDRLLEQIGNHGKKLDTLHLAYGGIWNSDIGLHHVLSGCTNLRKLSLKNCPFDGLALLANSDRLERMRYFWLSSSTLCDQACKLLRVKHPRLNVEVIRRKEPVLSVEDEEEDECHLMRLYVYRTIAGPRLDKPAFVCSSNDED